MSVLQRVFSVSIGKGGVIMLLLRVAIVDVNFSYKVFPLYSSLPGKRERNHRVSNAMYLYYCNSYLYVHSILVDLYATNLIYIVIQET